VKDKIKRNKKKTGFSLLIRLDSYLIVANAKVDGQLQKHSSSEISDTEVQNHTETEL
jgi:hypothetical protein